jgi:L-threonylcarbamoyladenylate synthase
MKTVLTSSITKAANFIRRNSLVAFPTETVYGLGANVFDESAVKKIFEAKGRPSGNPLIAHVTNVEQIQQLVSEITAPAEKFIAAFFPAPLTLVLPKSENVPFVATANLETIGVRMPNHALALEFLHECGTPLVAPSANLSGRPSPTTWQAVYEDLNNRIDCILQGEQTLIGLESTVVDCTTQNPLVLRLGAITLEELQGIVPETKLIGSNAEQTIRSPGLRYKHYAPKAKVILINSPDDILKSKNAAFIGLDSPREKLEKQKICRDVTEYAHSLFAFFRESDAAGINFIYCQKVVETGLGLALNDRLKRSSS